MTTMLSLAATPGGYWKTGVGSVSAGPARVARVRRGRSLVAGAGAAPAASSSDSLFNISCSTWNIIRIFSWHRLTKYFSK